MDKLQKFNDDKGGKGAILEFIHEYIDQEALRKMYANEGVGHIPEARILIDKAFEHLDNIYATRKEEKHTTNEAR